MKGKILILGCISVAVVVVAAVGISQVPELRAKWRAQEQIRSQLKDPSSSEFRNLRIVEGRNGARMVCGEVNARNSYGGLVGFKDFYAEDIENGIAMIDPGADPLMLPGILWLQHEKYCR